MDSIFCVEQINVPPELGTIMKQYTKAVLRDKPQDLYKYSANFFAALCGQAAPFGRDGNFVETCGYESVEHFDGAKINNDEAAVATYPLNYEEHDALQKIFSDYDVNNDGRVSKEAVPTLLADLQQVLQLNKSEIFSAEEILGTLDIDENGTIDLLELRQLLLGFSNVL